MDNCLATLARLRPGRVMSIGTVEAYRTFNMGMGYAFIAPAGSVATIQSIFPDSRVVGEVTEEPGVRLKGVEIR